MQSYSLWAMVKIGTEKTAVCSLPVTFKMIVDHHQAYGLEGDEAQVQKL